MVPNLVRCHAVPAAELADGQQKIDASDCGALNVSLENLDVMRRSKQLDIVPTLRMGTHAEDLKQLNGARMHRAAPEAHSA